MAGIPQNVIIPLLGIENDPTGAFTGSSTQPYKALIMGHQDSVDGTELENVPILITNADDAAKKFGIGSHLHQMCVRWFSRNQFTETYCIPIPEPTGGTPLAAKYSYTVTGTAEENGTLPILIDGKQFNIAVSTGDTGDQIATSFVPIINASPETHCFTASDAGSGVMDLDVNYVGSIGDEHDVRDTYFKTDSIPKGLTISIALTPGSGVADVSDSIDGIKNEWFNIVVSPFNDAANLNIIEIEASRRFDPTVQQDMMCFFGYDDTLQNSITFATDSQRNSPFMSMIDSYKWTQHGMFVATLVAAEVTKSVESDPGEPLHRITIDNLLPPKEPDRYEISELNTLTSNGICTMNPHTGPQTYGMVTMYLKNTAGVNDIAYQYQTTMFILSYLRYDTVVTFASRYPRARLADNAERIRAGIQVMTPNVAKAELISLARNWEEAGLVENIDQFKQDLNVSRNDQNPNRLDFIMSPDFVNQFIVLSGINQFKLQ